MQSIFHLPWCSEVPTAPRMQTGMAGFDQLRASPALDVSRLNGLKRKRTGSPDPASPQTFEPAKKQRPLQSPRPHLPVKSEREDFPRSPARAASQSTSAVSREQALAKSSDSFHTSRPQSQSTPIERLETAPVNTSAMSLDLPKCDAVAEPDVGGSAALQQVIENEFNMQILMKHNELRLIEQELAKCQVALEQLRRCELQPYPGDGKPTLSVTTGTGPSVAPPPGFSKPSHAAPHGVTDGPYTRHYQQWLLSDGHSDSTPENAGAGFGLRSSTTPATSARKAAPKPQPAPTRSHDDMKSLPNYSESARSSKGRQWYLKRSTDGHWTMLTCNNCLKTHFNSIQGFLNHCRIAHKVNYESHDAAAIDCGRVVDEHELANIPPEMLTAVSSAPSHKPSASRSSSTTTTPFKAHTFVHPLVLTDVFSSPQKKQRVSSTGHAIPSMVNRSIRSQDSFTASAQAPRLSAHFAKHGLGGNLDRAITSATEIVDFGEEVFSPVELDPAVPSVPANAGARMVPSLGMAPPASRKGWREPVSSRPRPSPLGVARVSSIYASTSMTSEISESPHDRSPNLSPHTVDSNPGLVSDHEDDDHGSASEDEVPQATIAHLLGVRRGTCTDSMDIDVGVDDELDEHSVVIRGSGMGTLPDERPRFGTVGGPSKRTK